MSENITEFWRRIIYRGIETDYFVSIKGNVWNQRLKSMISQFKCSSGNYLAVHIFINGIDYKCMVHRLVAKAFIPNPENKPQVNHKDANTFNNNCSNLEWCTAKENINHMINMGHQIVGKNHKNSKFTDEQIYAVCEMLQNDELPLTVISEKTGVSMKTIQNIRHGVGWKHIACDYCIKSNKRQNGPVFSPISKLIHFLVLNGKSNNEIFNELNKSGLSSSITRKSISDRIYHIRRINRLV